MLSSQDFIEKVEKQWTRLSDQSLGKCTSEEVEVVRSVEAEAILGELAALKEIFHLSLSRSREDFLLLYKALKTDLVNTEKTMKANLSKGGNQQYSTACNEAVVEALLLVGHVKLHHLATWYFCNWPKLDRPSTAQSGPLGLPM